MRLILIMATLFIVMSKNCDAKTFEQLVDTYYTTVVKQVENHGFPGPFGAEIARYALVRQIVEDGVTRSDEVSIVGMSLGGAHSEIMDSLKLCREKPNENGLCLKTARCAEGVAYYAIHGPQANVCSTVALALLWDRYVNHLHTRKFSEEDTQCWNGSKRISGLLAQGEAGEPDREQYLQWSSTRKKMMRRVNAVYNSGAAESINRLVDGLDERFTARLNAAGSSR